MPPTTTELSPPESASPPRPSLLPEQIIALNRCEDTIRKGLTTFFEVGDALNTIKLNHLYRATHDSFDDYCRDRWGIGRAYANRVIQGARVATEMAALAPEGSDAPRPSTEAHTRPLAPLSPEVREEVWSAAVADAQGGVPTGRQVLAAAQTIGLNLPTADNDDDDDSLEAPDPVEAVRRDLEELRSGSVVVTPAPPFEVKGFLHHPPKPGSASDSDPITEIDDWLMQMEAALLSIQNNGLIYPPPGKVRCVAGCAPVRADSDGDPSWRHAPDCVLGITLEMLREIEGGDYE